MALSKREKNLVVITGSLFAVVCIWFLLSTLSSPVRDRLTQREVAQQKVNQKLLQIKTAQKAQQKLDQWRRRSLPSDPQIAQSLYKNWLLELTRSAGLQDTKVDPMEGRPNRDVYRVLPFSIHSRGTLDELTEFLYEFYSKGHLQRIRQLTVKPREKSSELDLTITIEALSLPKADSADELSEEPSIWLANSSLDDYRVIGSRNLFAAYRPPPPPIIERRPPDVPRDPLPPKFDPGRYAFLTAIVERDGQPQVWLKVRTTGQMLTLAEGDDFDLGPLHGTVKQIHQRAAEIEIDGRLCLITLGKSLRESSELPE